MADDSPISVADVPKEDDQNDQSDQSDQNDQNGDEASEKTSVSSEPGSDHESNADAKEDVDEDDEAKEGSLSPSPEKPKIKKRKSSGRRKKSSSTSVSRPRSRKSRSRSARARPSTSNRHLTICWYGRKCSRAECWFKHPDGRECDERKGNGKGGKGEPCNFRRRRSSSAHRRRDPRERSASRQRYRSPQKSRRRVAASRSASTKPTRPRRGRKAEKECKDEGNPEGKQEGQIKEVKKNPLKKVNFREFMMNHCEDGASPEDAIVAFKVYCEDLAKKELDILKNTGLFFDLYHPMAQLRFYDWQRQMAQIRSHNFAHDLNGNKYHSLSLRARRPVMPGANVPMAPTCPVAGHLKAPEFAFDANLGALMISGLPVAVSTWDVVEAMQDFPGFITAAWTPPSSEKELSRTFYASFTDAKVARAAVLGLSDQTDLLSNKGLTTATARVSLLEASEISALVLPPETSTPESLKKDLELSAKVIRKMDDHFGISSDATSALLSHQLDTEKQLDIQILYLRRVHHFCFYSGKWCKDEWTLRDCCGAAALREPPSASGDDGPSVWGVGHEKRIHDFLQQAMDKEIVGRPVVLHHQEPKVLERFQRAANEKILKVHDQKFQCQACNKFFKGPEYVFKHLHRIHTNILDDVREELHQEIARSAFLADPAHPPAHAMTA